MYHILYTILSLCRQDTVFPFIYENTLRSRSVHIIYVCNVYIQDVFDEYTKKIPTNKSSNAFLRSFSSIIVSLQKNEIGYEENESIILCYEEK